MRRDKAGRLFPTEYEDVANRAESLGWVISCDDIQKGITFRKNNFVLWNSANNGHFIWHVAEVYMDKFISHKDYTTAYDAMYNPCVPDTIKGLGAHGLTPDTRIAWFDKELVGEVWRNVKKTGVVVCAHGLHNSFITVRDDDGIETYIMAAQLNKSP